MSTSTQTPGAPRQALPDRCAFSALAAPALAGLALLAGLLFVPANARAAASVGWGSAGSCTQNMQTNSFTAQPAGSSPTLEPFTASPTANASTYDGAPAWTGCVTVHGGSLETVAVEGASNLSDPAGASLPLANVAIGVINKPGGSSPRDCAITANQAAAGGCSLGIDAGTRVLAAELGTGTTELDWQYQLSLPADQPAGVYTGGQVTFIATAHSEPAPTNTSKPTLSAAIPQQGSPLTGGHGAWQGNAETYDYQWERCTSTTKVCSPIAGASSETYTPVGEDVDAELRVTVTAVNAGGTSPAASEKSGPVLPPAGTVAEYDSRANRQAGPVTTGPEGNVWYTNYYGVSVVTPDGQETTYPLGPETTEESPLITGPEGDIWVAGRQGTLYRVTPTGSTTSYPVSVTSIAAGPEEDIWGLDGTKVKVITASGTVVEERPLAAEGTRIALGGEGALWTSESSAGRVIRMTPAGATSEYTLPVGSKPQSLAAGPGETMWVAESGLERVAKITADGAISEYALGSAIKPEGLAEGPEGSMWVVQSSSLFSEGYEHDTLAAISSTGTITEYLTGSLLDGGFGHEDQITLAANNEMWFTNFGHLNAIAPAMLVSTPLASKLPVLSTRKPEENHALTVTNGEWANSPTSFSYQWETCTETGLACSAIPGATSTSYTPPGSQRGDHLRVVVSAANSQGVGAATSLVTEQGVADEVPAPANTKPPSILLASTSEVGTPRVGGEEHATAGEWSNSPTSETYQWELCNSSGANCGHIAEATGQNYTPTAAQVGDTLRVTVTATNVGGSTPAPSDVTAAVSGEGVITEYPTSASHLRDITLGPENAMWFTAEEPGKVGKITPTGALTEYTLPSGSYPVGITLGGEGDLWVANYRHIDKITPTGSVTEYSASGCDWWTHITRGPESDLWATCSDPERLARITPSGTFTEYQIGRPAPEAIAAGPESALWYAGYTDSYIGKITLAGTVTEYSLPADSRPQGVVLGAEGALWFTEAGTSKIGKITAAGAITEYALPAESYPEEITLGPEGDPWFAERGTSKIGSITPAGSVTEYALPAGSEPYGIACGAEGYLWFTEQGTDKIGRITP